MRKRVKEASGHEYYASLRTQAAIERAEVCVVVIDASESISDQDLRILTMVENAGRAMVIAYNKWDLTDEERRRYLEREIERDVQAYSWAPRVNISALNGRNVDKLEKAIETAAEGWETRISTGKLNAFLGRLAAATHTRCGEGNNRGSSSGPKPTTVRRRSPCSHRGYSTKDMCGSSSGGCVKTSASPVHPSMWRSDLGRSGRGSEQFCRRNGSTLMYFFGSPSDPNGLWRSLVAHLTGGQGVAGSNPVSRRFEVPTSLRLRADA